jgi:hypothetical protein
MYKRSLGFKDVGMARRNCVGNSRLCIHYLRHLDFEVTKHTNRRKAVFFIIGKASDLCDNTSMELIPIHFFDQPIEPIFDTPPALEKSPDCPNGFVWDGKTYRVIEMLSSWVDFKRRGRMARNMQPQHAAVASTDIAQRFNHRFGETFRLPEAEISETAAVLPGLVGRKMSKSYGNTIPLFLPEKQLRKAIMKIKTNSLEPGEPKDPDDSALFSIYSAFASPAESAAMRQRYAEGLGWGEAKQILFERINDEIGGMRAEYERLITNPGEVESILCGGAIKAREISAPLLSEIRVRVGVRPLA